MSKSHRLGYEAEHAIEENLKARYPHLAHNILRPRAGASKDKGDIHGLPVVISVKNYAEPRLAGWVDQMTKMVVHAEAKAGVVWHKRRGKGHPKQWYVTTNQRYFATLLSPYPNNITYARTGVIRGPQALSGFMKIVAEDQAKERTRVGVLFHNRPGEHNGFGYVTMLGESFLYLLDYYVPGGPVVVTDRREAVHG